MAAFCKEYRKQCGLRQRDICEFSDLSRSSVIRVEAAKPVSFLTICKYASALELPLQELFWEL